MEKSEVLIPIDKAERVQRVLHALQDRYTQEMPPYAEQIQDGTAFEPDDAA